MCPIYYSTLTSMLFNFQTFIADLRENQEKKEVVEKFEKHFGLISWEAKDQNRYTEYTSTFKSVPYKVPEELKDDFDRAFLMELVSSSFSSDGLVESIEGEELPDFVISVQSGDQVVVKKVSELRWFQILRLYEIYIEEQMNLQVLIAEDEKEKEAIVAQRDSRAHRWNIVLDNMDKEILTKQDKVEREGKLDDLMGQL